VSSTSRLLKIKQLVDIDCIRYQEDGVRWGSSLLAAGNDTLLGGLDTPITGLVVAPKVAANLYANH
jgi:hypothetical protein